MNKKVLIIIVAIIVLVGGWWVVFGRTTDPQTVKNYPSSGTNIIAFGDSLVEGVGATEDHDFVSLLSEQIGKRIINEGEAGNTTADGLSRIDDVLEKDPKLVIVLLGGNDALQKIPLDTTFKNLEEIIVKIQEKGAMVLLLGVQNGLFQDEYGPRYKALSEKYQTAYVPNILNGILAHKELMSDIVHPNNGGYQKITDKIFPVIETLVN